MTPSGVPGEDLKLSPKALAALPLVIECKNKESLNIWEALKQSESHASKYFERPEVKPAVIFKRNKTDLHIAMKLEDFLGLVGVVKKGE